MSKIDENLSICESNGLKQQAPTPTSHLIFYMGTLGIFNLYIDHL